MTDQPQTPFSAPPFDPAAMQSMWQQMMANWTQATGHGGQAAPKPSADVLRQMQQAYLEAMARWSDEYMRSEPFLQQMKQSLENSLAMRRQVEDFLRKASEHSFGGAMGMNDAFGAVRDAESWIDRRLDELAARLDAIEEKLDGEGASVKRTRKKSPARKSANKTRARKTTARKTTSKKGTRGKKKAR